MALAKPRTPPFLRNRENSPATSRASEALGCGRQEAAGPDPKPRSCASIGMKSILSVCYIQKGRTAHSAIDFKPPRIEILELCLMDLASSKHLDIFRKLKTKTRTEVKGNPICTYKIRAIFEKVRQQTHGTKPCRAAVPLFWAPIRLWRTHRKCMDNGQSSQLGRALSQDGDIWRTDASGRLDVKDAPTLRSVERGEAARCLRQ